MLTTIHWHRFKRINYKYSVYNKGNFMQQFDSVIQYNAIILSVLLRVLFQQIAVYGAYSNLQV